MVKVDLNIDLRHIPQLSFAELKAYYDALFNTPTTSTRKEYYIWRITYKLQEMRLGGLEHKTRRMLENMDFREINERKMVTGIELIKKNTRVRLIRCVWSTTVLKNIWSINRHRRWGICLKKPE